jgi:hypothetical protein
MEPTGHHVTMDPNQLLDLRNYGGGPVGHLGPGGHMDPGALGPLDLGPGPEGIQQHHTSPKYICL